MERLGPLEGEGLLEVPPRWSNIGRLDLFEGEGLLEVPPRLSKIGCRDLLEGEGLLAVPPGRSKIGRRDCLEGEGLLDGALGIGRCPDLRGDPKPIWGDLRVANGDQSDSLG